MNISILAALLAAGPAAGQDRFGSRGTISPSGSISVSYSSTPTDSGNFNSYGFSLLPGAMFFVADDVAIGGLVELSYTSIRQPGESDRVAIWQYGIAPAIGWNFWLGERVSVFPQTTLRASWRNTYFRGSSSTDRVITLEVFVPALFHVTSHFFLGLGPNISRDIDSTVSFLTLGGTAVTEAKRTTIGLQSVIGGWF